MKTKVLRILLTLGLLLILPLTLLFTTLSSPPQFWQTFYGEIPALYQRLKDAPGKRIVLIGNSALAFGVRTDLLEQEMGGYSAILFGVYGAVGTKAMLEISKVSIQPGDIVIIAPELYEQTASLYFSPTDFWRTADGEAEMLRFLSPEEKVQMVYAFPAYAAEKYRYASGLDTLTAEDPYSRAAFENEAGENVGYMLFERPYNVMAGGYDAANLPNLSPEVFGAGFLDYLNDYAAWAAERGASVYYGFTPLNALSLGDDAAEQADALYDYLCGALDFPVLGHPAKYIMDYRLFYDNNVHVNSVGALYYTDTLAEDLKLSFGIGTRNDIALPEAPEMPARAVYTDEPGDADCFLYEVRSGATGQYVVLTGLTEEGKTRTSLTLPSVIGGLPVSSFTPEVFSHNETISRIVLPKSITTIYDGSFEGASRLRELIFRHDEILSLSVGANYLAGADDCLIYIKQGVSVTDCAGGWARYADRLRYY